MASVGAHRLGGVFRLADIFKLSQAIGRRAGGNVIAPARPPALVWPVAGANGVNDRTAARAGAAAAPGND
jgi:hypothetical protein